MRSQYSYRRSSFFNSYFPPGVKWLIIINVAIFVLITLFGRWIENDSCCWPGAGGGGFHFTLWQLVTYLFIAQRHQPSAVQHARAVDVRPAAGADLGHKQFLKYYFLCGVGAGFATWRCTPRRAIGARTPWAHRARFTAC